MMPNKNIKVSVLYFQNKNMQRKSKYIPALLSWLTSQDLGRSTSNHIHSKEYSRNNLMSFS